MSVYSLLQAVCCARYMCYAHSTVLLFIVIALNKTAVYVASPFSSAVDFHVHSGAAMLPWHSMTCSQACGFYLHDEFGNACSGETVIVVTVYTMVLERGVVGCL